MFTVPKRMILKAATCAAVVGILATASVTAQAGPVLAGYTKPTATNQGKTQNGTVFFAVFQQSGGPATDPWDTGYDLANSAVRGIGNSYPGDLTDVSDPIDLGAEYLYVFATLNNGGTSTVIERNTVGVDVDSFINTNGTWGSFYQFPGLPGFELSTQLNISCLATATAAGFAVNDGAHVCASAAGTTIGFNDGSIGGAHTERQVGTVLSSVVFSAGSETIGAQWIGTGSELVNTQLGSVFYYTSDKAPTLQTVTAIIDGVSANGGVPSNIPEPMMLALLGSGLLLLGFSRRAKKS